MSQMDEHCDKKTGNVLRARVPLKRAASAVIVFVAQVRPDS